MGEALVRFITWLMNSLLVFFTWIGDVARSFFEAALSGNSGVSEFVLRAGNLVLLLLFISAPVLIAYGISRLVSRSMLKSMGYTDALISTGIFALAAAGGLGSVLGVAASFGGVAVVLVVIWMMLTAGGFLFGCREALGTVPAIVLSGLILPLSMLAAVAIYAA